MLFNISCRHKISINSLKYSEKNELLTTQRDEKASNDRSCDLIWNIRHEKQKEIFFRNNCTNSSCMVTWKSINVLGIWSQMHYDCIPPQSERSYSVSSWDVNFEVDYYFQ